MHIHFQEKRMNKKFIWLFSILLIVSLACSFKGSNNEKKQPTEKEEVTVQVETPTIAPTEAPLEPTAEPTTEPVEEVIEPTATAESSGDSYIEEFDGDTDAWYTWVAAGDASKNFTALKPGAVSFSLPNAETYTYLANKSYEYDNVYVEAVMTAKVYGDNGLAVICRVSEIGWYELRIHTTGMYAGSFEVYRYDQNLKDEKKNPYVSILAGNARLNSVDILSGSKTNTIGLLCNGEYITPVINGVSQTLPKEVPITDNILDSGQVGVGAMSFSNGKVEIEVESVSVEAQ
jgi:hypothetical protein